MANVVEVGSLYELNKQILSQLPPQSDEALARNYNIIGSWFGQTPKRWFMLMCKERSDFTMFHITDHQFTKAVFELQEVLKERGTVLAIQYVHGEDTFEIWVKDKDGEVFMFMLFEASWMIVEI